MRTPRRVLNLPKPWYDLLCEIARSDRHRPGQTVQRLLASEADQRQLPRPRLQWEQEQTGSGN